VLFQTADYATKNTYYPLNLIQNVYYNPAYSTKQNLATADFISIAATAGQEWKKAALNSSKQLINFTLPVSGALISYAYAQIDGKIYDFRVVSENNRQIISIVLDKDIILSARNIQLVLISADETQQQVISLK